MYAQNIIHKYTDVRHFASKRIAPQPNHTGPTCTCTCMYMYMYMSLPVLNQEVGPPGYAQVGVVNELISSETTTTWVGLGCPVVFEWCVGFIAIHCVNCG